MPTFSPEKVWIVVALATWVPDVESPVVIMRLDEYLLCIHKYPLVHDEIIRVCPSKGTAQRWFRVFKFKGGLKSWHQTKINSSKQKPTNFSK